MVAEQGPLSWQQERALQLEAQGIGPQTNVVRAFAIPEQLTLDELRRRLAGLAREQDALRISGISADGAGYVSYAEAIEVPLLRGTVSGPQEAESIAHAEAFRAFDRSRGPLWAVSIVGGGDDGCGAASRMIAVFDHLVSDHFSLEVFARRVLGDLLTGQQGRRLTYRSWVNWQRQAFPRAQSREQAGPAAFWVRHLDGTAPDRAVEFPFRSGKNTAASGTIQGIRRSLPVRATGLAAAASALRVTPFVVVLACLASTLASVTGLNDITLRVVTHGRTPESVNTIGWISTTVPVRLQAGCLEDLRAALPAARTAWFEVLEYQSTPWQWILDLCGQQSSAPAAGTAAQVLVNFSPAQPAGILSRPSDPVTFWSGQMSNLVLAIAPADGSYEMQCSFDPHLYSAADVTSLCDTFAGTLASACRKADPKELAKLC